MDSSLSSIGHRQATLFFYTTHRAIFMDSNVPRCKAMIKRLLQLAQYFPPPKICAVLVVIEKLMKARPELRELHTKTSVTNKDVKSKDVKVYESDDDDGEEKYEDVKEEEVEDDETEKKNRKRSRKDSEESKPNSSWVHVNLKKGSSALPAIAIDKDVNIKTYDLKARNPAYAGAQFSMRYELLKFVEHYHPTVQVFATNLINSQPINYNGNPLRDFSLTHFLDRFSFRNPKKITKPEDESRTFLHKLFQGEKEYRPHGSRNIPVNSLTERNCTEDEKFIFAFLRNQRARKAELSKKKNKKDDDDDDEGQDVGDVDDDEFDAYLDSLGAEKEDLDYLNEINDEISKDGAGEKKKKKKVANDEDDDADERDYFSDEDESGSSDDDDDDGDDEGKGGKNGFEKMLKKTKTDDDFDNLDSDGGSISMDDDDDDDDNDLGDDLSDDDDEENASVISFSGDENDGSDDDQPKSKKRKVSNKSLGGLSGKDFNRKLKQSDDMSSLFAAADDFSQILEDSGRSKKHGSLGEVFNKDKASVKQMAWEENRYNGKKTNWKKKPFGGKFNKKSQHPTKSQKTGFSKKNKFADKKRHRK